MPMLSRPRLRRLVRLAAAAVATAGVAATAVAVATGTSSAGAPARVATRAASWAPCGHAVGTPRYDHVMWVVMENDPYGAVIGSPSAPFTTSLAHTCGVADHYHAVTHPSLPNYLALTAGSTFGVSDDAYPSAHRLHATSIFSQVSSRHRSWRAYEESMGPPCEQVSAGLYAVKHNPAAYFVPLRPQCRHDDMAMGPLRSGTLTRALHRGSLPSFAFVTPNVCDDGHSCPLARADRWLRAFVHRVTASRTYRRGHLAVFVTWDEGSGADQRVPLLVVAPSVPRGQVAGGAFDHYSLLRTTEQLLGLAPLRRAAHARSMVAAFHL